MRHILVGSSQTCAAMPVRCNMVTHNQVQGGCVVDQGLPGCSVGHLCAAALGTLSGQTEGVNWRHLPSPALPCPHTHADTHIPSLPEELFAIDSW